MVPVTVSGISVNCYRIPHSVTWIGHWNPSCPLFEQNGTRHLLRAFGTTHVSHFSHGVMGIGFQRLLSDRGDGRSSFLAGLV
jgi:hypothetical protein